ncbi:shikimate kinase, partial [Streptomyces sp. NPDC048279]|uniref:shikimate kinase n=1 Tax=Streptomyces sp. NPDC048279 TaxID=3154714 RepID=UPI00341F9FAF
MGVGKSTVGELLAQRLGIGYRDTDGDIVAAEGRAIADIFVADGEAAFREIEKRAVQGARAGADDRGGAGGGAG